MSVDIERLLQAPEFRNGGPDPGVDVLSAFSAVREAVDAAIREEREALEWLCYLALRDGRDVLVERWGATIYDARITPYGRGGQIYIVQLDKLGGFAWDSSGTWPGR